MRVLEEFGNEGEGKVSCIFLDEFGRYWYVVLLGGVVFYVIYKVYGWGKVGVKEKMGYYVVEVVSVLIGIGFRVFGMGGGMSRGSGGIRLSNGNE